MPRFDGKVAIITGAASGIGKEIAMRFAAEGGIPIIADLNLDAADATAREIKSKGSDSFAVGMNVADEAAVEKGVADTMAKYGRIDVLVSNAGIQIVKPVVELPFADWKRLLSIHLDGAFLTTRAALRHMYGQGRGGSIVFVGSKNAVIAWAKSRSACCCTVCEPCASHGYSARDWVSCRHCSR